MLQEVLTCSLHTLLGQNRRQVFHTQGKHVVLFLRVWEVIFLLLLDLQESCQDALQGFCKAVFLQDVFFDTGVFEVQA